MASLCPEPIGMAAARALCWHNTHRVSVTALRGTVVTKSDCQPFVGFSRGCANYLHAAVRVRFGLLAPSHQLKSWRTPSVLRIQPDRCDANG